MTADEKIARLRELLREAQQGLQTAHERIAADVVSAMRHAGADVPADWERHPIEQVVATVVSGLLRERTR